MCSDDEDGDFIPSIFPTTEMDRLLAELAAPPEPLGASVATVGNRNAKVPDAGDSPSTREGTDGIAALRRENGALRAAFRVNMLRLGFDHGDVDQVLAEIAPGVERPARVRVKPLGWVERVIWNGTTRLMTEDGRYWVCLASDGWIVVGDDNEGHQKRLTPTTFPIKEAAQAAVQALHAARVLAAVETCPIEVTDAMVRAALESRATDEEGTLPTLGDLLDFGGENKARIVVRAALEAALAEIVAG